MKTEVKKLNITALITISVFLILGIFIFYNLKSGKIMLNPPAGPLTQSPVPTKGADIKWQTYFSDDDKFQISYPEKVGSCVTNITLSDLGLEGRSVRLLEIYCATNPKYVQIVYEKTAKPLLDWWYTLLPENKSFFEKYGKSEDSTFAEQKAIQITYKGGEANEHFNQNEVLFAKENINYLVLSPDFYCRGKSCPNKNQEQQIIDSFRFTENEKTPTSVEGSFCGGIMGRVCPAGYSCKYDGNYPDAGGTCVKN